jgi:hypothetical protein
MNRILLALALAFTLGASACAAWFTVDGYEVAYADVRPTEAHRRWVHRGVAVYELDGHYYRQHEGRWVVYRERPRELEEYRR